MKKTTHRFLLRAASICIPFLFLLLTFIVQQDPIWNKFADEDARTVLFCCTLGAAVFVWYTFYVTKDWRNT